MRVLKHAAVAIATVAALTFAGVASADPVVERKELMKAVGKSTKLGGGMVRGKVPFDGAKAAAAMTSIAEGVDKFVKLFPKGSDQDPETEAGPKIWSDMKGFLEANNKFKADASAAATAAGAGEGAFKAAFGKLVQNCKGCHQDYRIKK